MKKMCLFSLILTMLTALLTGCSKPQDKNPIASTYDAIKSYFSLSSSNYYFTDNTQDNTISVRGSFAFGNSFDDTVIYETRDSDVFNSTVACYNGEFAVKSSDFNNYLMNAGQEIEWFSHMPLAFIDPYYGAKWNAVVKNKHFDFYAFICGYTAKYMEHYNEGLNDKVILSDKAIEQAFSLVETFIYKECEKPLTADRFIINADKISSGKLITYTYGIKLDTFAKVLKQHVSDHLSDNQELKTFLDEYAHSGGNSWSLSNADELLDKILHSVLGEEWVQGILSVSVIVDSKGILQELSMGLKDGGNDRWGYTLTITDHNIAKPDIDEVLSLITDAKTLNNSK